MDNIINYLYINMKKEIIYIKQKLFVLNVVKYYIQIIIGNELHKKSKQNLINLLFEKYLKLNDL